MDEVIQGGTGEEMEGFKTLNYTHYVIKKFIVMGGSLAE